ncbi:hypothetical protein EVAR_34570_1 [Eumeta japonica]|uniref:Uncharacterized protein n=1 Tax=Eumeta variegata TaxID=151549 RepID=A0A4C1X8K6_EUMVA|nr:hypothetical protein EVAR_34570_1 [Eumeta japonica]
MALLVRVGLHVGCSGRPGGASTGGDIFLSITAPTVADGARAPAAAACAATQIECPCRFSIFRFPNGFQLMKFRRVAVALVSHALLKNCPNNLTIL